MNNLREIRAIYGATQNEIAKLLNVSRARISQWEGEDKRSLTVSQREKLSLFFGVGPEVFYDEKLNPERIRLIEDCARRAEEVKNSSGIKRSKVEEFNHVFSNTTFNDALTNFMVSMKILLATADKGDLKNLKTAQAISKKMGERLQKLVKIKEEEEEESLFKLIEDFETRINSTNTEDNEKQ